MQARADDRGSAKRPDGVAPAAAEPVSALTARRPDLVLALQRRAGNAAVAGALGQPVQRLATTSAAVAAHVGRSRSGGVAGIGVSTYASIRKALADYEKAQAVEAPQAQALLVPLLERLDLLCTKWLNENGRSASRQDVARRRVVSALVDEVAAERAKRSAQQAQEKYLHDLSESMPARPGAAPEAQHPFAAATSDAVAGARKARADDGTYAMLGSGARMFGNHAEADRHQARLDLVREKGLTPAEHAAITLYSGNDYKYVNAATTNSPSWMEEKKAQNKDWAQLDTKTLMEEGAVHSGVAMQGLAKLDPYLGMAFRGESMTPAQFRQKVGVGKELSFTNLTSSSKLPSVALGFSNQFDADRDIAVLWGFTNSGGRDIQALSSVPGEAEVLILPGKKFAILSVEEVVPGSSPSGPMAAISSLAITSMASGTYKPRKCYAVHVVPMPGQAPAAPAGGRGRRRP